MSWLPPERRLLSVVDASTHAQVALSEGRKTIAVVCIVHANMQGIKCRMKISHHRPVNVHSSH